MKLPVVFLIEDNGYAISVPVEVQTAGGDVSRLVEGFPDLLIERCDGTDPVESLETLKRAVEYCRQRKGPALVHAKVIRPYSHSLSDDEKLYRPDEERTSDAERDPVKRFGALLVEEGFVTQDELQKLKDEVDREVNEAADAAPRSPQPAPDTAAEHVYRPTLTRPPRSSTTKRARSFPATRARWSTSSTAASTKRWRATPRSSSSARTWPTCRASSTDKVKGKGGVFKVTANLSASSARRASSTRRCRGQHRRSRHRDGRARTQARRRDVRLHLPPTTRFGTSWR